MHSRSSPFDALGLEVQDMKAGAVNGGLGRLSSDLDAWTRNVDDDDGDDDFMATPDLVPLVSPKPRQQTLDNSKSWTKNLSIDDRTLNPKP